MMTEYNDKQDRIAANNWFGAQDCLAELDRLKFSYSSIAEQCGTPGSYAAENAKNAEIGFSHRVDYLHDSLRRLLGKKEA